MDSEEYIQILILIYPPSIEGGFFYKLHRRIVMTLEEFISKLKAPAFGTILCQPINCGAGLSIDDEINGGEDDSYMLVLGDVTSKMYRDFLSSLAKADHKETFHREFNGNIFAEFADDDKIIYTYYTAETMLARIIIDNASSPLSEMNDTADDVRGDTALMQFSLRYGKMIRFYSCDCGMLYVMRMRDNSVIIIDGGEIEQCTEEACDEFMSRLEELTGKKKGEKIRVSAYLCTHNHDDHMDFFIKLLKREKDVLSVERVMFNFPSKTLLEYGIPCADKLKSRIKKYAPNAKFLKLHTGQTIRFPDARIEVLTTHEDILPRSARAEDGKVYRSVNETSTIFQIIFDDCSVIFLGDAEEANGESLLTLYGKNSLSCKYLQCAHHLINDDRNIYSNINAEKLLIPQCRYIAMTRECDNARHLTRLFGAENMYYAGDCTYVFTIRDGNEKIDYFEQKGYLYDNSGY